MQRKAVRFLRDVVGDPDRAEEFESMSPQDYAEHKGVEIVANPNLVERKVNRMTRKSRADLEAELKDLQGYVEELEDKIDTIADVVAEGDEEEDEEEEEGDDVDEYEDEVAAG